MSEVDELRRRVEALEEAVRDLNTRTLAMQTYGPLTQRYEPIFPGDFEPPAKVAKDILP